jgi:RND family efflux transporter MFP subunit
VFFDREHVMARYRSMALCAIALATGPHATFAQTPPAPPVQVAQPLQRQITEWDEYTGRFEAAAAVEVRPRVAGFLEQIHFRDGETVQRGARLFTIDQRPYQLAVASAQADVERARSQVTLAEAEVERALPLLQNRTIPQRDFDTRQANLRSAQAGLQAAQASLDTARLNLEWTVVTAPIAGRTSDRRVDVGNLVAGGAGAASSTLLTTIVALDPIYFVFDASEADYLKYVRLAQGGQRPSGRENPLPVLVRLADEAEWRRRGRLDFVDNVVNPRSGTIRGRAVFENADGLLTPGVFGRMRLWAGETQALLVPDAAVLSDQARKIVLTVSASNEVVPKIVTLGQLVEGLRVVRSGLTAEDRVIVNGLANPMVRPGARVTPQPTTLGARPGG